PIEGEARPVPDYSDRGAHPPAWWHDDLRECGRRVPRTSALDDTQLPSPLQRHLARARRPRSS
ncbi:hypothetical protein ACGFY0_45385, partial [Streptomyces chartreusis]|uniref:hypothetical protein n=1 Tax=Streptomyces chartreusis TaxID=1969 RepID=UPI00371C4F81